MNGVKKILLTGLYSAFALISFMLENLFPPLFITGGRIGIANIFVLFAGITLGFRYGLYALTVKSVLGSIFCGNISAVLYSLPAGVIAYAAQTAIIFCFRRVSVIAASVTGGALNAVIQNAAFCVITATPEYFVYSPYLALIGALGGLIVGTAVYLSLKFLPAAYFDGSKPKKEQSD